MGRGRATSLVGLSIEPGLITAAQVSMNGSIVIESGGRGELDHDVVRDGEVADGDALAESLRDLWREHKELGRRVRIGVANTRIVVRTLDLPPIADAKQLAAAVRFQAADEIPMPLKDAVLDFRSVGIIETPAGPRQRVVLVAARRDMIMSVLTAAQAAGLKPTGIDLSAFGMIRALRRGAGDAPELFIGVGGLTNLAIADHGVCAFTRVTGGGLESLAVELAERREMTPAQARAWLFRVGLEAELESVDGDPAVAADARTVLSGGVRKIAAEIRASLDFLQGRDEEHAEVGRVVLGGPAVAVAGFAPALASELELAVDARFVDSAEAMNLSKLDAACLSVAAGLAVESGPLT